MCVYAMQWVFENAPPDIYEFSILIALADYLGKDGIIFPKVTTLAKKARMSERQAQITIKSLEGKDLLRVERTGRSSRYHLIGFDPPPRTTDTSEPHTVHLRPAQSAPEPSLQPSPEPKEEDEGGETVAGEPADSKVPLPSNWTPSPEDTAYATSYGIPDHVICDEAQGFRVYWSDRNERRSPELWTETWRARVRDLAPRWQRGRSGEGRGVARSARPGRGGPQSSRALIAARLAAECAQRVDHGGGFA